MRRSLEHIRRYFAATPRVFAAALAMLALSMSLFTMVLGLNIVTVTDTHGANHVLLTGREDPEAILQLVGLDMGIHDELVYTVHSENTASLVVNRAFPVTLEADGKVHRAEFVGGTVSDMLLAAGVTLTGEDYCVPSPSVVLEEDMHIAVYRVTYESEALRGEVPEDLVDAFIAALPEDVGFTKAKSGIYNVEYMHRYVGGEYDSSELLALEPVITPRDAGGDAFEAGVPVSTIESFVGVSLDEDGVPTEYSRVMEGAVATAYSSSGGRGAGGLGLYTGTVAVNPNVIPYGTRLYITSADNSFVYGYAIATDTGTAMMEGRVDIDLYFATNAECLRFGKRALNVYILD